MTDQQEAFGAKRKKPSQKRALATLQAIREAALQVLEQGGLEKFRTTRVAQRAGVSVGSLYQYYRNREELLEALVRAELADTFLVIERHLTDAPRDERARAIVRALIGAFSQVAGRQPVLLDLLLSSDRQAQVGAQVLTFLRQLSGQIEDKAQLSSEATFVLTRAVLGVVRSILLERTELASSKLEDQLVLLIRSYAVAAQADSGAPSGSLAARVTSAISLSVVVLPRDRHALRLARHRASTRPSPAGSEVIRSE